MKRKAKKDEDDDNENGEAMEEIRGKRKSIKELKIFDFDDQSSA